MKKIRVIKIRRQQDQTVYFYYWNPVSWAAGSVIWNVVPLPGSLSHVISPP
jgi:hypothetical protein